MDLQYISIHVYISYIYTYEYYEDLLPVCFSLNIRLGRSVKINM